VCVAGDGNMVWRSESSRLQMSGMLAKLCKLALASSG
jgi:hypothetical protein